MGPGPHRPTSQSAGRAEHGVDVAVDAHTTPRFLDDSAFVDQERASHDPHVLATVVLLFGPHTVSARERLFGVGEQRERKSILSGEAGMARFRVRAHADDLHALLTEAAQRIAKAARFARTSARVVLWIEIEHVGLAGERARAHDPSGLIGQAEARCAAPFAHATTLLRHFAIRGRFTRRRTARTRPPACLLRLRGRGFAASGWLLALHVRHDDFLAGAREASRENGGSQEALSGPGSFGGSPSRARCSRSSEISPRR